MNKIGKTAALVALAVAIVIGMTMAQNRGAAVAAQAPKPKQPLPRLLDVGSKSCIPCKMMAPMLRDLRKEYAGRMQVDFIDAWLAENAGVTARYDVKIIPTQVFFDPAGKELFRHEGFFAKESILAKWAELGYTFGQAAAPTFERFEPARKDTRPQDAICFMCDADVVPKTIVRVQTDKGPVNLCSPHCYFIMYSCLTQDKAGFEKKVSVTDWATGKPVAATDAVYLYGLDDQTGRPVAKAFASREVALQERQASGGSVIALPVLQRKELSHRCGFCDRACYPEDAAEVICSGVHTWGCCSHCALGVAARTGLDIEVHQPDRLTGDMVVVKTLDGQVASLEPKTAVAWFGMRQRPNGKWGSAGCFHQGFFTSLEHLKQWVAQTPYATGRMISIHKALSDKMKLSPQQIQKACKIGECAPK